MSQRMMHIGELAERSGLSLRTIRHYDDVGLLTPSGRTEGGFRLYTESDFDKLMLVRRMKPLGFSLDEMARLLELTPAIEGGDDAARGELAMFVDEAQRRRDKLQQQLEMADEFLGLLRAL